MRFNSNITPRRVYIIWEFYAHAWESKIVVPRKEYSASTGTFLGMHILRVHSDSLNLKLWGLVLCILMNAKNCITTAPKYPLLGSSHKAELKLTSFTKNTSPIIITLC